MGTYTTTVNAGDVLQDAPLGAAVTLQPSVLWALGSFRSRLGVHYLTDLKTAYGLAATNGMGFSGYFYPFGISSAVEISPDDSLKQVSQPGPYVHGAITPLMLNLSKVNTNNTTAGFAFSALIFDIILGAGFEYPIQRNMLLAAELVYRSGSAPDTSGEIKGVDYSGLGINLSFMTSYY